MEKQPLNRIKVMLAERMLTNKQLAEMLGKDPATISKWVTNTSQPTLENLIEIARCLKCDMNDLVRLDAWLEDVISNLEFRFGVKPDTENIVSFDHNDLLKGTEFFGELIESALNHQPLNLLYRTFAGNERTAILHPYHIKQFNNRWFLIGLQEGSHGNYITNKALDRIVKFSRANVPFIPNTDIDFNEYFKDIVGVTLPEDHPVAEEVLLKFDEARFPYVVNKPIHPSQEIEDEERRIIKLMVRPNKELEARIFSYGNQVEVLKPEWLRRQIAEKIENLLKKYSIVQKDCNIE